MQIVQRKLILGSYNNIPVTLLEFPLRESTTRHKPITSLSHIIV